MQAVEFMPNRILIANQNNAEVVLIYCTERPFNYDSWGMVSSHGVNCNVHDDVLMVG